MRIKKVMRGYDIDDALAPRSVSSATFGDGIFLPAIGLLAAGAAIGAGIGLALAPSSGRRLRQDIGGRLDQLRERVKREAQKSGVAQQSRGAPSLGSESRV